MLVCTIINDQGRKSRSRTPDDLERAIRTSRAQGIHIRTILRRAAVNPSGRRTRP